MTKRRLAILLAFMITASAVPAAGVTAAEAAPEGTTGGSAIERMTETGSMTEEEETAADTEEEIPADSGSTTGEEETAADTEEEFSAEAGSTTEEAETAADTEEEISAETGSTTGEEETAADTEEEFSVEAGSTTEEAEIVADTEEEISAETGSTTAETEIAAETEPGTEEMMIEEPVVQEASVEAKAAVNSFVHVNGKKYYYDAEGKLLSDQWLTFGDFTYYIGADGAAYTGFKKIGGRTYYFKDSRGSTKYPVGAMELGWQKINGMKFYFADSGYPAIGNNYPGAMLTGWRRIDGEMYYFADSLYPSANRGRMMDGWRTISGRKYYFGTDGIRRTGFQKINGKTYYFIDSKYSEYTSAKQGIMLKAVKKIGGKYYFFSEFGVMKTGWIRYSNVMGYYNTDGTAASGWRARGDDWYYLKENGIAFTGWLKLGSDSIFYMKRAESGRMVDEPQVMSNGKLYFFDEDGRRATSTGWRHYGKYYYYTYSNGTCAVSTTIDGVWLDENGRTELTAMDIKAQGYYSSTNYLILVDRSIHKVGIYKGRQGNWINIKRWSCGDGKPSTPTIEGTFTVGIKLWYFDSGSARCWFATQFCGNYLFHSVLYYQDSYPADVMDGTLGAGVSHGCVRLEVSNARWIYDNIPGGTKVVVYH